MLGVIVLAFQPLYETLALGQTNLLLFAGIALAVRLWSMRSAWSGIVLGMMAMVKPQFALLCLLWIRSTEWRHLGIAVATMGGLELGSLAVVGVEDWLIHVRYMRELPCGISLWAPNISVRGFLFRLQGYCLADGFGDPMAVIAVLIGAVAICMLAWFVWTHPPTDTAGRFHAASLILCTIFLVSPYTQEHHLTVLLIAFTGLALDRDRSPDGIRRWGWVGAYVLLATAYSLVQFPAVHVGLPSVLLLGKGLGVILLGVFLVLRLPNKRQTRSALLPLLLVTVGGARAAHAVLKVLLVRQFDLTGLLELYLASVLLLSWFALRQGAAVKG